MTSVVRRINGRLKTIYLSDYQEDWLTTDEYFVDSRKSLRQLKRVTADFTYQINKEELWTITNGKAKRISDVWKDSAGEPVDPIARGDERAFDDPAYGRIRDFPFALLITDEYPDRWVGRKRCIPLKARSRR